MPHTTKKVRLMPTPRQWGYWPLVGSSVALVSLWFAATMGSRSPNAVTAGEALGLSLGPAVVGSLVLCAVSWTAKDFPAIVRGVAILWLGYAAFAAAHMAGATVAVRWVTLAVGGAVLAVALVRIHRAHEALT